MKLNARMPSFAIIHSHRLELLICNIAMHVYASTLCNLYIPLKTKLKTPTPLRKNLPIWFRIKSLNHVRFYQWHMINENID